LRLVRITLSLPCGEQRRHNPPCVKNMIAAPTRRSTMVGLALALFSMPLVSGLFTAFRVPLTTRNVLLREIILFALAALVLFIIRRKEQGVNLRRPTFLVGDGWLSIPERRVCFLLCARRLRSCICPLLFCHKTWTLLCDK